MGNSISQLSPGSHLLQAAADGDRGEVRRLLAEAAGVHGGAQAMLLFRRLVDRASPLLAAAGACAEACHACEVLMQTLRQDGAWGLSVQCRCKLRVLSQECAGSVGTNALAHSHYALTRPPARPRPPAAGHHRVVQQLLEAAVMHCTPERIQTFINHTNRKGQSALILACAEG